MTTAKTPEEIVEAFWLGKLAIAEIRAYGEQCASQALAEQRVSKPVEPTKLEMVARAISPLVPGCGGAICLYTPLSECVCGKITRAAIEALRFPVKGDFADAPLRDFNAVLQIILNEKQMV